MSLTGTFGSVLRMVQRTCGLSPDLSATTGRGSGASWRGGAVTCVSADALRTASRIVVGRGGTGRGRGGVFRGNRVIGASSARSASAAEETFIGFPVREAVDPA